MKKKRHLRGGGNVVRGVRLAGARRLDQPDIRSLIEQTLRPHGAALRGAAPLKTLVKSVSAKQRPRRPATARARPAGP